MKYKVSIVALVVLTACKASYDVDLSRIKAGMSIQEVRVALKKDSCKLSRVAASSLSLSETKTCRGDIFEYDLFPKQYQSLTSKINALNTVEKARYDTRCKYWLYFYNNQLNYIKWGQSCYWNSGQEVDSLITNALKNDNTEYLRTAYKLLRQQRGRNK